jgi:hypothetical protein
MGVSGAFLDGAELVDFVWKGRKTFENEVRTKGFSRYANVAIWNQDDWYAGSVGRSDVGAGVADHDALVWGDTQLLHDGLQGQGVWFLLRCRITADYAGEKAMYVQRVQDLYCHSLWFVGAQTLLSTRVVKVIQHAPGRR